MPVIDKSNHRFNDAMHDQTLDKNSSSFKINAHASKAPPDPTAVFTIAQGNNVNKQQKVDEQQTLQQNVDDSPSLFSPLRPSSRTWSSTRHPDNQQEEHIKQQQQQQPHQLPKQQFKQQQQQQQPQQQLLKEQQKKITQKKVLHPKEQSKSLHKKQHLPKKSVQKDNDISSNTFLIDRDMNRSYEYEIGNHPKTENKIIDKNTQQIQSKQLAQLPSYMKIPTNNRFFAQPSGTWINTPLNNKTQTDNDYSRDIKAYIEFIVQKNPHIIRSWSYKQLMRNPLICELMSQGKLNLPRSLRPKNATCIRSNGMKSSQPTLSGVSALIPQQQQQPAFSSLSTALPNKVDIDELPSISTPSTYFSTQTDDISPRHAELLRPSASVNINHAGTSRQSSDVLQNGMKQRTTARFRKSKHFLRDASDTGVEIEAMKAYDDGRRQQRLLKAIQIDSRRQDKYSKQHLQRLEQVAENLLLDDLASETLTSASFDTSSINTPSLNVPLVKIYNNGASQKNLHNHQKLPLPITERLPTIEKSLQHLPRKNRHFVQTLQNKQVNSDQEQQEELSDQEQFAPITTTTHHDDVVTTTTTQKFPQNLRTYHQDIITPHSHTSIFQAVQEKDFEFDDDDDDSDSDRSLELKPMLTTAFNALSAPFSLLTKFATNVTETILDNSDNKDDGEYHDTWGHPVSDPSEGFISVTSDIPQKKQLKKTTHRKNVGDNNVAYSWYDFYEFDPTILPEDQKEAYYQDRPELDMNLQQFLNPINTFLGGISPIATYPTLATPNDLQLEQEQLQRQFNQLRHIPREIQNIENVFNNAYNTTQYGLLNRDGNHFFHLTKALRDTMVDDEDESFPLLVTNFNKSIRDWISQHNIEPFSLFAYYSPGYNRIMNDEE